MLSFDQKLKSTYKFVNSKLYVTKIRLVRLERNEGFLPTEN